jgi:acyl-coenzyme A thioesterase PaaI-like protein
LSLAHHELCFGCGNANLFGLQMELEPANGKPGAVTGRCFIKQDHQGALGSAHAGVVSGALEEAMAIALHSQGIHARARRIVVDLLADAPVGTFLRVDAHVEAGGELTVTATAREVGEDKRTVAEARGHFEELGTRHQAPGTRN